MESPDPGGYARYRRSREDGYKDGGLNGEDTFRRHPGTSACAGASFESQVSLSDQQMHIVVNYAP